MDQNVVIYSYYLNINFGFIDHQAFQMRVDGWDAVIYFEKLEHASFHPYKSKNPNWEIQNGVSFDPSVPNRSGGQDVIGNYFIERADIFSTGYTRNGVANLVNIRFCASIPQENREAFAESCLARFLDVYRVMTFHGYGDNYLNNKNPVYRVQEGLLSGETQFRQDALDHGVTLTLPPEDALSSFRQRSDAIDRIAGRLQLDRGIQTFEKMLNAGKKLIVYDEDYPLAIVMFGTAFETYVQTRLLKLCEDQGIATLKSSNGKDKPYREAIEKGNIGYLLEKHLCDLTNIQNIRAQQVCSVWNTDAYEKRNRVIHRGDTSFTREEAEQAYLAVIGFIEFIHAAS
ncbi:hypothetical protein [Ruegeria atlantica]|uniref:hypothetical protein n=1 Tax=Ruegeria atlantica TaxID=81569 RepID=UPI00147D4982|nr:hypothetical protein [Ruegeria atlantica]